MELSRLDFAKVLFETVIPSDIKSNEVQQKLGILTSMTNRLLPNKLYRYRAPNESAIDALKNDRLYFSTADYYNDVFDCLIFTNKDSFLGNIRHQLESENLDNQLRNMLSQLENIRGTPKYEAFMTLFAPDNRGKRINEFIQMVSNEFDNLQNYYRSNARTICLAEDVCNSRMWGTYANNGKGFCLEYQFDSTIQIPCFTIDDRHFNGTASLFPIIYASTILDGTDFINTELLNYFSRRFLRNRKYINGDLLFTTKAAITKDSKWEDEKEWRILASLTGQNIINNQIAGYILKKPSAIYLGIDMETTIEIQLINIAKEKALPVYKMHRANDGTFNLGFEPVL